MNPFVDISSSFSDPQMLHAALAHVPIGLAMIGVPLLFWVVLSRPQSRVPDSMLLLVYSAAAGLAYWTAHAGEQATAELPNLLPAEVWDQVDLHTNIAERVWIFAAVTAVILLPSLLKQRTRIRFTARTLALLMGVATMIWTLRAGHEGGKLVYVYGVGTPALEIQTHRAATAAADLTSNAPLEADTKIAQATSSSTPLTFASDVQPVFTAHCISCHNSSDAKADLDLTTLDGLLKGGKKAGPALLLDSPDESPFLLYVRGEFQPRMPKDEPPLSAKQVALLGRWAGDYAANEVKERPSPASSAQRNSPEGNAFRTMSDNAWSPRRFTFPPEFEASLSNTTDVRTTIRYDFLAKMNTALPAQHESREPELHFILDTHERLNRYQRYRRLMLVEPSPRVPTAGPELDNPIDRFIYDAFQKANIVAPELATDGDWVRRVFLDLLGVYPEFEEVEHFVNDASKDKYERLLDTLLQQRSDYADHWIPQWEDALSSGTDIVPPADRVRFRSDFRNWLAESFGENRPLDEMVLELFKAEPDAAKGRYILSETRDSSLMTAADIAQVFLGEAMRCASCHNHFKNPDLTLARTLSFASYFSKSDHELIRCGKPSGQFLAPSPPFDLPEFEEDASGSLKDRKEIAGLWLVDPTNDRFAQVMVNRIWKRYFGVGLYEPADQWSSEVEASHPELLRWLADDFRTSGFDVERTVRLILTSRTYRHAFDNNRASKFDENAPDAPRYFESPAPRRLTAEQYWDSVRKVLGFRWQGRQRTYRLTSPPRQVRAMGRPIRRIEARTERPDNATVDQALLMLNDETFNDLIARSPALLPMVKNFRVDGKRDSAFRALYQLTLLRDPTDDELRIAKHYFEGMLESADRSQIPSVREAFLRDTCWALLTSPEFLFVP